MIRRLNVGANESHSEDVRGRRTYYSSSMCKTVELDMKD